MDVSPYTHIPAPVYGLYTVSLSCANLLRCCRPAVDKIPLFFDRTEWVVNRQMARVLTDRCRFLIPCRH